MKFMFICLFDHRGWCTRNLCLKTKLFSRPSVDGSFNGCVFDQTLLLLDFCSTTMRPPSHLALPVRDCLMYKNTAYRFLSPPPPYLSDLSPCAFPRIKYRYEVIISRRLTASREP